MGEVIERQWRCDRKSISQLFLVSGKVDREAGASRIAVSTTGEGLDDFGADGQEGASKDREPNETSPGSPVLQLT